MSLVPAQGPLGSVPEGRDRAMTKLTLAAGARVGLYEIIAPL